MLDANGRTGYSSEVKIFRGRQVAPTAWRQLLRPMTLAAAFALAVASGCGASGSGEATGPLRTVNGHFTNMLFPMGEPSYATFPVCSTEGDQRVKLVSLAPEKLSGADRVEFRAAWIGPSEDGLTIGAGRLSELEAPFGKAEGTEGTVASCDEGRDALTIAVLLPDARTAAAVVDGVEMVYAIDGREHTDRVAVTFGVCASDPAEPANEPEDCDPSSGG